MWKFSVILAADSNWGIGKDNKLPWPMLKPDMAYFKAVTVGNGGNAVVMGRKTWESLPQKFRPLPDRHNVVITSQQDYKALGASVFSSLDTVLHELSADKIFVIGGAQVYNEVFSRPELKEQIEHVHLTRVHGEFDCDTFVSPIDLDVLERTNFPAHNPPFEIIKGELR